MTSIRHILRIGAFGTAVLGLATPSLLPAQVSLKSAAPSLASQPVMAQPTAAISQPVATVTAVSGATARITEKIDDHKRTALAGHIRPFLTMARDEGEVEAGTPTNPMMLVFSRTAAQQASLDAFADSVHNRSSASFHQWLTPQQFGAAYSPADSDIAQVQAWLESKGLKVLDIPPSKTFISFTGTVGQLKSAFGVSVHKFTINGEKHAATVNDPQVPTALASVVGGIRGLDNFGPRPLLQQRGPMRVDMRTGKATMLGQAQPTAVAGANAGTNKLKGAGIPQFTDQEGNYQVGPQDFYTIYNETPLLNAGITGAGQTIAVIEEALINPADVTSFRSVFGLPAYPATPNATGGGLRMLSGSATGLNGYASCYSPASLTAGKSSGEEGEAALDAEWSGAVAPNAIVDFVACGGTATSADGTTIGSYGIDHAAQYVVNYLQGSVVAASMSYGQCEASTTNSSTTGAGYYSNQWQQFAVEGITPIISSGDAGAAGCYQNQSYATTVAPSVNAMASSAWNISAGGTDLSDLYETNDYTTAPVTTWWNATNSTGLGSAISYVPESTWAGYCSNRLFISYLQAHNSTTFGSVYNPIAVCSSSYSNSYGYTAVVGGSGGISTYNTIPSWQSVYGVGKNSVSTTYRNSPDVSLFAASGFWGHLLPFCESDQTACTVANYQVDVIGAGGTSFVAPQLAGLMALVTQKTGAAQGQANYTIYNLAAQQYGTTSTASSSIADCSGSKLAAGQTPPTTCVFHDISNDTPSLQGGAITSTIEEPCQTSASAYCDGTIGSTNYTYGINVVPGTTAANGTFAYLTGPGYDDATGLGSVNITNLVNNWTTVTPKFTSATALASNASSAGTTAPISFTATITATGRGNNAVPAGTVTFYNSANKSLGSANVYPACTGTGTSVVCNGMATLNTTGAALSPSSSTYTATFAGDAANDAASSSSTISVIGPAAVQVISPTLKSGTSAYITAYFVYPGLAAPTGPVTMTVNGSSANISAQTCLAKASGTNTAHMNCTATYSGVGVASGNYSLVVTQAADSNYAAATGTGFVTVTPSSVGTSGVVSTVAPSATAVAAPSAALKTASLR